MLDQCAEVLDKLRIIPRLALAGMFWMAYWIADWYMALETPTNGQSGFAGLIITAGIPAATKFYMETGQHGKRGGE